MIIEIEVEKIRTLTCFSYSIFHPFVETLKEYRTNKKIDVNNTSLAKFYKYFKPENLSQVITGSNNIKELRNINKFKFLYPWSAIEVTQKPENKLSLEKHGSQHFGPVSKKKLKLEYTRLINLYHSIKTNGYNPKSQALGYILNDNNSHEVLILTAGHHRVAVMTVLGYKKIPIQLYDEPRAIVYLNDIDNWTFVKNGFFSKESALKIFYKFFNDYRRSI